MIDRIFSLVPSWVWLAAVAALTVLLGLSRLQTASLETDIAEAERRHALALAEATAKVAERERQWINRTTEVANNADAVRQTDTAAATAARGIIAESAARARARAAGVGGAGLRPTADGLGLRPGPGSDRAADSQATAVACDCQAAAEAARVHAELYGWALARLAAVGEFADRSWLAADTCERAYAVTEDAPK